MDSSVKNFGGSVTDVLSKLPESSTAAKKANAGFSHCLDEKGNSVQCPVSPENIPADIIAARDSLDFMKSSGAGFKNFLYQGPEKNIHSEQAEEYQSKIDLLMDYIKKQGGPHCFPGGAGAYQNFCLARRWKDLELTVNPKTHIESLQLYNKDGSYFQKIINRKYAALPKENPKDKTKYNPTPELSLGRSWILKQKGSSDALGMVSTESNASDEDLFNLDKTKISISQINYERTTRDHYGTQIKDFTAAMKDKSFTLGQLKKATGNICDDIPVDPREFYELALNSDKSISLARGDANSAFTVARNTAYGLDAGLNETGQNYIDAGKSVVEGAKALGAMATNSEVSFCSEGKDMQTPPVTCEGAFACKKPENGKWCIGSLSLLKKVLGTKGDEILKSCEKEKELMIGWPGCIEIEIISKIGKAAWGAVKECYSDLGRCGANVSVLSASVVATMGVGVVANGAGAAAIASVTGLLKAGALSANLAKVLVTATMLTVQGVNFTADLVLGGMPIGAREAALSEMKSLLKAGTLVGAEKEMAEKLLASASAKKAVETEATKSQKEGKSLGGPTLTSKEKRIENIVKKNGQEYLDEAYANASIKDPKARMTKIEEALAESGQKIDIDEKLQEELMKIHERGTFLETDSRDLSQKITDAQKAILDSTGVKVDRSVIEKKLIRKGLLGSVDEAAEKAIKEFVGTNEAVIASKDYIDRLSEKASRNAAQEKNRVKALFDKGERAIPVKSAEENQLPLFQDRHQRLLDKLKAIEETKMKLAVPDLPEVEKASLQKTLANQIASAHGDVKQLGTTLATEVFSDPKTPKKVIDESRAVAQMSLPKATFENNVSKFKTAQGDVNSLLNDAKFSSLGDKEKKLLEAKYNKQMADAYKGMVNAISDHIAKLSDLENFKQTTKNMLPIDALNYREKLTKGRDYVDKIKREMDNAKSFSLKNSFLDEMEKLSRLQN